MVVFRVCRQCDVVHVENCNSCFGFGLMDNLRETIVTAEEAWDARISYKPQYRDDRLLSPSGFKPCPECTGTIYGVGE